MLNSRRVVLSLLCLTLLAGAQVAAGGSRASVTTQQGQAIDMTEDVKRAIELYQQNDDKGAIELLRRAVRTRKDDVTAWHYLGLAYERQGELKYARQAHEAATKAGEIVLEWIFANTFANKGVNNIEQFKPVLLLAVESADRYLKLNSKPPASKVQEWNSRAEILRDYAEITTNNAQGSAFGNTYKPAEVTTKARIFERPAPHPTEEATEHHVAGTVVLRAIFAFDGKIRGIRVVSGLPYGLTLRAIDAARKIRFTPAMLKGQPVSQYIQIEYNFDL